MSSQGKHSKGEAASTSIKSAPAPKAEQQSQVDFELDFFEGILNRNPDYIDVLRVHGNNLTLKGLYAEGLKIDRRIVDVRPRDALAHYNLACSFALLKRVDPALRALRRAIELGYRDFCYMREDRDLVAIRKDPRFRRLLAEFETVEHLGVGVVGTQDAHRRGGSGRRNGQWARFGRLGRRSIEPKQGHRGAA